MVRKASSFLARGRRCQLSLQLIFVLYMLPTITGAGSSRASATDDFSLFDQFARPEEEVIGVDESALDEVETQAQDPMDIAELLLQRIRQTRTKDAAATSSRRRTNTRTKANAEAAQSAARNMASFSKSREYSKAKLNISIGTGDAEHPLSDLVFNDEVVIGRKHKGGIDPDDMEASKYLFTKASVGRKTMIVSKCDKSYKVLAGGCQGPKGVGVMRPLSKSTYTCRGVGDKKISSICSGSDSPLDTDTKIVRAKQEAQTEKGEATCPEGYVATGGGCDLGVNSNKFIKTSGPYKKGTWRCEADGPVEEEWSVYAICLDTKRNIKRTLSNLEKNTGKALAVCPEDKKVIGGGCHIVGRNGILTYSQPHISGGWQCKSDQTTATVMAIAVCGEYKEEKSNALAGSKEAQALIAPAHYNQMNLHISHTNDHLDGTIVMSKPLILSPGDAGGGVTAQVFWGEEVDVQTTNAVEVPYARNTRTPQLFDDDDEAEADIEDALEVIIKFSCFRTGIFPMMLIFEFKADGTQGYERITLALHKNCTEIDEAAIRKAELEKLTALPGLDKEEAQGATLLDDADLESPVPVSKQSGGAPSESFRFPRKNKGSIFDLRVGLTEGGGEVIKYGRVMKGWDQSSQKLYSIDAGVDSKSFYIALEPLAKINSVVLSTPVLFVSNSSIVKVKASLVTSGTSFKKLELGKATVLTVTFTCLEPGSTSVAVGIDTSVGTIRFEFAKKCRGEISKKTRKIEEKTQGLAIPGFMIGTSSRQTSNVIENGLVRPEYFLPEVGETLEDSQSLKRSRAVMVPASQPNITFYVGMDGPYEIRYSRPTVFADSDKPTPIAFPELYGSYMVGNSLKRESLSQYKMETLTVRFNCIRSGVADVIVSLPLVRLGTLRFAFRKRCDTRYGSERPKTFRVNGLNIGNLYLDDVVKDGVPTDGYSWGVDANGRLIEVGPEIPVSRFMISRDIPVGSSERIVFEEPTITPHRTNIIDPEVGQGTPPPFTLTATSPAAKMRFVYHCQNEGSTLVTIALPWKLIQETEDMTGKRKESVFMSTIHLHLWKTCNDPHNEVTRDEGGVDIPGFNVGYEKGSSNVIRDGYPTRHYFGQRNRINPDWKAITVPAEETHTRFFVSYVPASSPSIARGEQGYYFQSVNAGFQAVEFDPPIVHNHDGVARPRLLGQARDGLHMDPNTAASLTIQWNCAFNGTAVASVRIPIRPTGFITFTVPKICESDRTLAQEQRRQERLASGMYVSTYFDEDPNHLIQPDVVDDGHTSEEFSTYKSGKRGGRFAVDPFEHSTLFFLWQQKKSFLRTNMAGVSILEPMIFTHRPICNPSLEHNFEFVDNGGFGSVFNPSEMLLMVDEMMHAINVTYNCVWEGETAITVVIPMANGGKISFTWTKICAEAEYDQHIPHCVQYKTPEESETILGAMWEYVTSFTVAPGQESVHIECEQCEDGYVVLKADELLEDLVDVDGDVLPPPVYKRDECVRNSSHFGFEDESFDNMDTEHLEEDLAGNMPLVGEVDNNEGWHEHDELNWKGHAASAVSAAENQGSVLNSGLINIGSRPNGNDVIKENTATPQYALQGGDPRVISSSETESKFYLSIPEGFQKIGYAEAKARLLEGESACSAQVEGPASRATTITAGESLELTVKYTCERPGATAVLVVIPLEPSSSVSFRMHKLCNGYQTRADRAWYAHKSVLLICSLVLVAIFCGCGDSFMSKRRGSSSGGGITLVPLSGGPEAKYD